MATRCVNGEKRPFRHPLTGVAANCYDSFNQENLYQALAIDDGTEPVYIIQRLSSLDAFYFPARDLVVSFRLQDSHVAELFGAVDLAKRRRKSVHHFAGFILAHHRPYHYFYDVLPAFNDIDASWEKENEHKRAVDLIQLQGGDYLPLNVLYPDYTSYTSNAEYLNHSAQLQRSSTSKSATPERRSLLSRKQSNGLTTWSERPTCAASPEAAVERRARTSPWLLTSPMRRGRGGRFARIFRGSFNASPIGWVRTFTCSLTGGLCPTRHVRTIWTGSGVRGGALGQSGAALRVFPRAQKLWSVRAHPTS